MARGRLMFSSAVFALLASQALAAPRTQIVKTDPGAKIVFYDSLCDEDNSVECLIAEIGCNGPGDFAASVFNLDSKQAAAVFAKANGKGSVAVGASNWSLQVSKIALSEFTFNWDVTAISLEKGRDVWRAIGSASEVQLTAGIRKAALRRSDVDEASFRDVVGTCAAE